MLSSPAFATALEIVTEELILPKATTLKDVHAASVIALSSGELLLAFYGKEQSEQGSAEEANSIWISRGVKGKDHYHWSEPKKVLSPEWFKQHHFPVKEDNGRISCGNPVLVLFRNQVLLFAKIGPYPRTWTSVLLVSSTGGIDWEQPRVLYGVSGPAKNKPLVINNTLIVPASRETAINDFSYVELSQDLKDWFISQPIRPAEDRIFEQGYRGFIQPTLIGNEVEPQKILMLLRPRRSHIGMFLPIYRTLSSDGGKSWELMKPLSLLNADSAIDALRISKNTVLLVYNRVVVSDSIKIQTMPLTSWNKEKANWKGRNVLSMAFSYDEGLTWKAVPLKHSQLPEGDIENHTGEEGEYSYPAMIKDHQGTIHLVYTVNRKNIKHVVLRVYDDN